jgi:CHAT domain-containing protein/Tfp pilus assembly protein PilF
MTIGCNTKNIPRIWFRALCILLVILPAVLSVEPVHATSFYQGDDPMDQCAKGAKLFDRGNYVEALPLLESGFMNRENAVFPNTEDLGYCAFMLGTLYFNIGKMDLSLEVYQVALKLFRAINKRDGEGYTLNNIAAVYYAQGQYAKTLEYLQQALPVMQEIGNRAYEGGVLNNIGDVYQELGQFTKALDYYEQALIIMREVGDWKNEGAPLNNIGNVYRKQGQYVKSLEYYQQALVIMRKIPDRGGEGKVLNNIGVVYDLQGRYIKALDYYQRALVIYRDVGDRASIGGTLSNIGGMYSGYGQYKKALEYAQQALVIRREVGDRPGEGETLQVIAVVYTYLGQYVQAWEYYQQALVIAQEVGNRPIEGTTLNNIGCLYQAQGKYEKALEYAQQALVIRREIGDRPGEGETLHLIATVNDLQGHFEQALEYYQQALVIRREVGDRPGEGGTLSNIGSLYHAQGQYEKALEYAQQALVIMREVGDRASESGTLNNIGSLYQAQGQFENSLNYYEQAISILETLRAVAGNENDRAIYVAQYSALYNDLIQLYFQQNLLNKAFITSERGRARAFLDSMATGYVELNDDESATLYISEQEAYAMRQSAQETLAKARAQNPPDKKLIADLETQLAQSEKDYQAALDAISKRNTYLEQLIPGRSKVLDVSQAQAMLDEQTTLLSFWVLDDQTLVFVLTKSTFNTVVLPTSRTDLLAKIKAFRDFSNTDVAYPESAIELYQVLINPLKTHIITPNLVIVPQGELHYLPFAALTDGKRYLVDDYAITYLPSVSAWPYIKQNIIGNPITDQPELQPLPFAESEAQTIAALYKTKPLLGKAATESTVRRQVGQAGVLHLAVHGSYNTTNPLDSAIYLTPDGQHDGLLETREIYGLNLKQTDLVVLSACETQLGELSTGDELVGLTRAFFFAGTPSVISSLWSVNDKATQLLMEKFYSYWRGGMGKAESLRRAQMDMRAEYPNPYYWAGFILSGDGEKSTGIRYFRNPMTANILIIVSLCCCCLLFISIIVVTTGIFLMRKRR